MTVSSLSHDLRILPADQPFSTRTPGSLSGFSKDLQNAINEVDGLQLDAQQKVVDVLAGNGTDVHEAAIAVEKADLSFQLMVQMRNKVVQAYQQIAGMQF